MEQKNYDSPTKSPVIQEIIMSNRIGAIAIYLSKQLGIGHVQALKLFYESKTCADLHDKSTGLYLYGDLYVADEFIREMENRQWTILHLQTGTSAQHLVFQLVWSYEGMKMDLIKIVIKAKNE